jgi:hypothetical protein
VRESYKPGPDWRTRPGGHPFENWPPEWQQQFRADALANGINLPLGALAMEPQPTRWKGSAPPPPVREYNVGEESSDRMRFMLGVPLPHEQEEWCRQYDAAKPERDKIAAELEKMCFRTKTMEIGE